MVKTRGTTNAAIQQFEHDAKNWKLGPDDFVILSLLGQGGEGSVYHAWHKASGMHVALKRIPFHNAWDNEQESRIHVQLQHSNILRMYGMYRDMDDVNDDDVDSDNDSDDKEGGKTLPPSSCWIILEYCRAGTMQNVMATSGFAGAKAKEAFVAKNMHAILRAVQYMHAEPHCWLHRDIKPMNILYDGARGEPLLADFGMCASLKQSTTAAGGTAAAAAAAAGRSHEFVGTVIYMAPEVLALDQKYRAAAAATKATTASAVVKQQQQQHGDVLVGTTTSGGADEESGYSFEADAWSLGVTTYELLFGKHPFPIAADDQKFTVEMCRHVSNNFAPCDISFPSADGMIISAAARHFILSLVQVDPKKRMTVDEALCHPWILRHAKQQQHAATAVATTAKSNQHDKENKPLKPRASKNQQAASKNGDKNAAVKQVSTPAPTAMSNHQEKENNPQQQQQQQQRTAKNKEMASSSGDDNNNPNDAAAVQQLQALLGGLNINQV